MSSSCSARRSTGFKALDFGCKRACRWTTFFGSSEIFVAIVSWPFLKSAVAAFTLSRNRATFELYGVTFQRTNEVVVNSKEIAEDKEEMALRDLADFNLSKD